MLGYIKGVPVQVTENALKIVTVQVRRHKKRRINKKWLKRYGVRTIFKPAIFFAKLNDFGGKLILVHPEMYARIKEASGEEAET